jgi:hypothetical protein
LADSVIGRFTESIADESPNPSVANHPINRSIPQSPITNHSLNLQSFNHSMLLSPPLNAAEATAAGTDPGCR